MDWVGGSKKSKKKCADVIYGWWKPIPLYLYWIYTITYVRERWFSDPLLGSSWIFTT